MPDHTSDPTQLPLFDPIEIKITNGYTAIADPIDADLAQQKWHISAKRYATGCWNGNKHTYLHRIILERMLGRPLEHGEMSDHINGNTLDNRRSNLRVVTRTQNNQNVTIRKHNKSGYKGVSLEKKTGRWVAVIQANNKRIHLGTFDTPEEAYAAYCEAAKKYHGKFARFD